jgi:hypothetical protein
VSVAGTRTAARSLRALLDHAIDYAGLFPPAALSMREAVAAYHEHRRDPDAWALARFVVPVTRLDELAAERRAQHAALLATDRWLLSALVGANRRDELGEVAAFNLRDTHTSGGARIDALELRADSPDAVAHALSLVPGTLERFVEIPLDGDLDALIAAIREGHAMAKVRTGGVTGAAFPSAERLAAFLASCVRHGVAFKATAGLHHPLRAEYRLTYDADSARGPMFGFLNVFLAAAALRAGSSIDDATRLLEERDASAFTVDDEAIAWHGVRLGRDAIEATRRLAIRSFGSCSFREPVDELATLAFAS